MSAPALPGLLFNSVTFSGGTTAALWISQMVAQSYVTGDDGATIPASARWVFTSPAAGVALIVPAATSPIAGKIVIVLGWDATGPGASAMLGPSAAAINTLYMGCWYADTGTTVSAADMASVWTTNAASAGFSAGTGTFSGYTRLYNGVIPNKGFVFLSDDYIAIQIEETTGGIFAFGAGAGVRAPTDSTTDSESGLGGRVFDMFNGDPVTAMPAAWWTANGSSAGILTHSNTANDSHWRYKVPGATTDSSAVTMRAMSRTPDTGGSAVSGFWTSDATQCLSASGAIEPEHIPLRDIVGTGGRNLCKVGRHRAFMVGPRRVTKAILSAGATKKWIAFGRSSTVAEDSALLPYS